MSTKTVTKMLLASITCVGLLPSVMAQQSGGSRLVLEEVTVTAQRREESLQSTPVAATAIGASELAIKQITNILDLQYAAPNISIGTNTGTANAARIFVRGAAGEDESRATAEPAVRVYVDGIYIGRSVGALHYGVKT